MIRLLAKKYHSLRWFIFFSLLISGLLVFLGTATISSLHYENLMLEQAKAAEATPVTLSVRLNYILSFAFFSLFVMAIAAYISHLATRYIYAAIHQFQHQVKKIETAEDLRSFDAHPQNFIFEELRDAFTSVNQLAAKLDTILVDKKLLQAALGEAEREDRMAADILYGHLIDKNADNPLGISHYILSSSHFSGDIVLVRTSPSGSIFVLLADATGHGLSATITIMPIISIFDTMVKKGHQLPFILREMNKRLLKDLPDDRFVAAVLIEIDPLDQELRLWNGGMPESLQLTTDKQILSEFRSKNMALGILDDSLFSAAPERMQLPKEGFLLCSSDGLTEQESPQKEAFGRQRFLQGLEEFEVEELIPGLLNKVEQHAGKAIPDDDISLVLLDFACIQQSLAPMMACQTNKPSSSPTPFQWQIRVQGKQLVNQALPALTNDFLRTLGMPSDLIQQVYNVAHELTSRALHENLLQLPANLKNQLLEQEGEDGLQRYYQLRREALQGLDPESFLELRLCSQPATSTSKGYFQIEVKDNGQGQAQPLKHSNTLLCHYHQIEQLDEEGHHLCAHL